MKIKLQEITIREVCNGYKDSDEEGIVAFGGRLNVRPKYQREFVYKNSQRDAVIETVRQGFPLNVMYWVKCGEDLFEVLDGQQRTISICEYIEGNYSIDEKYFHNLTKEEKDQIYDYKLMVYICEGTDKEKLDWFKTINIAGEKLYDQELRNAVYTGDWLTDAKRYFSKRGCAAFKLANIYLAGVPERQDYLETVIKWINDGKVEAYMAKHQHDSNANELWLYFNAVIQWVKTIFPEYRKEMKGVNWGKLYNQCKDRSFDANELEKEVSKLMKDEDVSNKSGIYTYLLTGDERYLNIRAFPPAMKREAYERQNGICAHCGKHFDIEDMEADHVTPWHLGGKTIAENCKMLCRACNRTKSGK